MYKQFREKSNKSIYLPVELIAMIEKRAEKNISSFNKIILEVLLKEFLFSENKNQKISHE